MYDSTRRTADAEADTSPEANRQQAEPTRPLAVRESKMPAWQGARPLKAKEETKKKVQTDPLIVYESKKSRSADAEADTEGVDWGDESDERREARLALMPRLEEWLNDIPIGGRESRHYNPVVLVRFALDTGLEESTPDDIYRAYVEREVAKLCTERQQEVSLDVRVVLRWKNFPGTSRTR